MPLVWLVLAFSIYTALQTFALRKVYPATGWTPLYIAFTVANIMGFLGVVLNGIVPPIPMSPGDALAFVIMLFLGLTGTSGFAIKFTLDTQRLDYVSSFIMAAVINLILCMILGWPIFYATLSTGTMLFSTS